MSETYLKCSCRACGGRIEFAFDMDRMDKSFVPRVWDKTPPHHLWMLKFPGDAGQS